MKKTNPTRARNFCSSLTPHVSRLTPSSGLTLVEVLVGMTIMVIALIPLLLMVAGGSIEGRRGGGGRGSLRLLRSTRNVSKCVFIAQELLDEHVRLLRNTFDSFGTNYATANCTAPMTSTNSFAYDEAPFRWSTVVCDGLAGSGIPDLVGGTATDGTMRTLKMTVWYDDNRNNVLDSFEDSFTLNTKVTSRANTF